MVHLPLHHQPTAPKLQFRKGCLRLHPAAAPPRTLQQFRQTSRSFLRHPHSLEQAPSPLTLHRHHTARLAQCPGKDRHPRLAAQTQNSQVCPPPALTALHSLWDLQPRQRAQPQQSPLTAHKPQAWVEDGQHLHGGHPQQALPRPLVAPKPPSCLSLPQL